MMKYKQLALILSTAIFTTPLLGMHQDDSPIDPRLVIGKYAGMTQVQEVVDLLSEHLKGNPKKFHVFDSEAYAADTEYQIGLAGEYADFSSYISTLLEFNSDGSATCYGAQPKSLYSKPTDTELHIFQLISGEKYINTSYYHNNSIFTHGNKAWPFKGEISKVTFAHEMLRSEKVKANTTHTLGIPNHVFNKDVLGVSYPGRMFPSAPQVIISHKFEANYTLYGQDEMDKAISVMYSFQKTLK